MNQMTTGASNDFERATQIARDMVTRYGMSDALGPMVYGENEGEVFLGRSVTTHQNMSEETMRKRRRGGPRDHRPAVRAGARLLEDNRDKVEAMAKALLEWETIDADQIDDIMSGRRRVRRSRRRQRRWHRRPARRARRAKRHRRRIRPSVQRGPLEQRRCAATCTSFLFHPPPTRHASTPLTILRCGRHELDLSSPCVMGIVNVTADSFSDGGRPRSPPRRSPTLARLLRGRRGHHRRRRRVDAAGRGPRAGGGASWSASFPIVEALAARGRRRFGRHDEAGSDARGDRRGRVDDQRRQGIHRAGRDRGGRRQRCGGVPDAHAGRAAARCSRRRATTMSWPRSGAFLRRRGRGLRRRRHRARSHRRRSGLWLRQVGRA